MAMAEEEEKKRPNKEREAVKGEREGVLGTDSYRYIGERERGMSSSWKRQAKWIILCSGHPTRPSVKHTRPHGKIKHAMHME